MFGPITRFWRKFKAGKKPPVPPANRVGRMGEDAAVSYLRRNGYDILERNFRVRQGEIDVVAFRDGVIAFVEVRTQTAPALIDPLCTVTSRKQRRIARAAKAYCSLHRLGTQGVGCRMDVIAVLLDAEGHVESLRHVQDAFQTH